MMSIYSLNRSDKISNFRRDRKPRITHAHRYAGAILKPASRLIDGGACFSARDEKAN